ncbi:MAG: hypothetical protein ACLSUW_04545 [Akkermansia sp.]
MMPWLARRSILGVSRFLAIAAQHAHAQVIRIIKMILGLKAVADAKTGRAKMQPPEMRVKESHNGYYAGKERLLQEKPSGILFRTV